MKQIIKNILFFILFFFIAFLCWGSVFLFGKGFLWLVHKVNIYLNNLCLIRDLEISKIFLDMIAFSFVGMIGILLLAILFYFFFFRNTSDIN